MPPTKAILVVEDSEPVRRLIIRILTSAGHSAIGAPDFETARQALQTIRFDLLVADVVLPGGPGTELAELINNGRERPMPALLITGYEIERAKGANVIQKPFTPDELLTRIRSILGED